MPGSETRVAVGRASLLAVIVAAPRGCASAGESTIPLIIRGARRAEGLCSAQNQVPRWRGSDDFPEFWHFRRAPAPACVQAARGMHSAVRGGNSAISASALPLLGATDDFPLIKIGA